MGKNAPGTYRHPAENLVIGPPPSWIEFHDGHYAHTISHDDIAGGCLVLLSDRQIHAGRHEEYFHIIKQAVTESGLQEASALSFVFHPGYESVRIHEISVIRSGERQNRLDLERFHVLPLEDSIERYIYNGLLRAVLHLEDIRLEDVVDFSCTVSGTNPVYRGRVGMQALAFPWPIALLHLRILLPRDQKAGWKAWGGAGEPVIASKRGCDVYQWTNTNAAAFEFEDNMPDWPILSPAVFFSLQTSWREVAGWACGLFTTGPVAHSRQLNALIGEWKKDCRDQGTRFAKALRFVQGEIRYLAIEFGKMTFRPVPPGEVLRRRYGDCKEKALLLITLLRGLGIDAVPVLVNTVYGSGLSDFPPSIQAFNHVIVRARIGTMLCHADPTINGQRGKPANIHLPEYGYGLVVSPETNALAEIPGNARGRINVEERFAVGDPGWPGSLSVETRYEGGEADNMRRIIAMSGMRSWGRMAMGYYTRLYGGAEMTEPVSIDDDEDNNVLTMREAYKLVSPWQWNEQDSTHRLMIYAEPLRRLFAPATHRRKYLFRIPFPVDVRYFSEIRIPDTSLRPWYKTSGTKSYKWQCGAVKKGNTIIMKGGLKTLRDHVPANEMKKFTASVENLNTATGLSVDWSPNTTPAMTSHDDFRVFIQAILYTAAVIGLFYVLSRIL